MLNVWKQVGLKILESEIVWRLVALGDRCAVCKGYGITTSFEPACRAHDFFICSEVQKLELKIIKQHESAKYSITSYSVHLPRLNKCFFSPGFCLYCGDYMLVGRCWTLCNLFPIRNLAVSQHAPSILQFSIFFQSFPTFCYFVYHLLLSPGTGRFFRNRRCDFQQSNVAMLVFCFFAFI